MQARTMALVKTLVKALSLSFSLSKSSRRHIRSGRLQGESRKKGKVDLFSTKLDTCKTLYHGKKLNKKKENP